MVECNKGFGIMGQYVKIEKGLYRWYDDGGNPGNIRMEFKHRGRKINRTTGKATIEAARMVMAEAKHQIDTDLGVVLTTYPSSGHIRLSRATEIYFNHVWKGAKHGIDSRRKLRVITQLLKDPFCHMITTESLRELRLALAQQNIGTKKRPRHRSPTTINRYVAALKTVLLDLHSQGYIGRLPKWEMVSEKPYRRDRLVTDEELAAMIEYTRLPVPRYGLRKMDTQNQQQTVEGKTVVNEKATAKRRRMGLLFRFLSKTGMRVGEATAITYDRHIKMDRRAITITADITKGHSVRTIPMCSVVHDILSNITPGPDGRPFPFDNSYVSKVWRQGREHMGITDKHFVPHAIRHTVATRLIENGVPVAKVQALLGHEDISTTMIYTHLSPIDLADDLERI